MSIVATMVFPNGGVVMYADKRAVTYYGDQIETTDNYLKIHNITSKVLCGITGFAEWCLSLVRRLKDSGLDKPSDFIKYVMDYPYPLADLNSGSTITLAGIYDDGRPFLWTYRTSGGTTFVQDGIGFSIATNPEDLGNICGDYLTEQFDKTKNPHLTLKSLIEFASNENPKFISQAYDMAVVPFKLPG